MGLPAARVVGWFGYRIGATKVICLALVIYVIVVFWAWRMTASWEFYGIAAVIGLGQGGIQAMSRALFARLIPPQHAGRLFGLYNMMGKFAAVIGPLLVGWVTVLTDSSRSGILSILMLFLAGAWLLSRVDVALGEHEAKSQGA